jgi:hypothetical protein
VARPVRPLTDAHLARVLAGAEALARFAAGMNDAYPTPPDASHRTLEQAGVELLALLAGDTPAVDLPTDAGYCRNEAEESTDMASKKECKYEGEDGGVCRTRVYKKSLCRKHFDAGYVVICHAEGCDADAYGRGRSFFCKKHHEARGCAVEGCTGKVMAKGRCAAHYNRRWRRKAGEKTRLPMDAPVLQYGIERVKVSTRIPKELADIILKRAPGTRKGVNGKATEILIAWAEQQRAAQQQQQSAA